MVSTLKPGKCRLKELLVQRRLTQTELARRVGLPRQQITDYANNRYVMRLQHSKNIADVLRCAIDDLYEWVDDKNGK